MDTAPPAAPGEPIIGDPTTSLEPSDLAALFAAIEERDHRHPLSERKWLDLCAGYTGESFGIVAREGNAVVGYVHAWHGPPAGDGYSLEVLVHPAVRETDLMSRLLERVVAACRARSGGHHHDVVMSLWLAGPSPHEEAAIQARGFTPQRDLYELRRPLPVETDEPILQGAPIPPGARLRTFRLGSDEAAWLALNNRVFREHPEQGRWSAGDLATRLRQPWFEAEGLLLLEKQGRLIGTCWTKRHGHEHLGEIYVIGVDPREHGRRLGTALTLAGLDSLWHRGARTGMLYCDADNEVAMRLYAKLGFEIANLHRAYGLTEAARA